MSDGDDDLSSGAALLDVPDGIRYVAEWVGPVDDRRDLPGLDQFGQDGQVFVVLVADERAQLLADEPRQEHRPDLAIAATEPPPAGLSSDDDEPALRGERPSQA